MEKYNKLPTSKVREYWREVFWETIQPLWEYLAMKAAVVLTLIAIIAVLIAGGLSVAGIISVDVYHWFVDKAFEIAITLALLILVLLLLLIVGMRRRSAEKYAERGGFIENPFIIEVYHSNRKLDEKRDKWALLKIQNKSTSDNIENCFLRLDDIVDKETNKSIIEDGQKLTWSNKEHNRIQSGNQPLLITANDFGVCDIARTEQIRNTAYYTTWFGHQKVKQGKYKLTLAVFGTFRKQPKSYMYQANLKYEGGNKMEIENPIFIKEYKND